MNRPWSLLHSHGLPSLSKVNDVVRPITRLVAEFERLQAPIDETSDALGRCHPQIAAGGGVKRHRLVEVVRAALPPGEPVQGVSGRDPHAAVHRGRKRPDPIVRQALEWNVGLDRSPGQTQQTPSAHAHPDVQLAVEEEGPRRAGEVPLVVEAFDARGVLDRPDGGTVDGGPRWVDPEQPLPEGGEPHRSRPSWSELRSGHGQFRRVVDERVIGLRKGADASLSSVTQRVPASPCAKLCARTAGVGRGA